MERDAHPTTPEVSRRRLRWGLGVPLVAALGVGGWLWLNAPTSEVDRIERLVDQGEGAAAVLAITRLQEGRRSQAQIFYLEGYLAFTRGHPATAARLYRQALLAASGEHPRARTIQRHLLAMAEGSDCQAAAEAVWGLGLLDDPAAVGMLERLARPGETEVQCDLSAVAQAALDGDPAARPASVAPTIPEPTLRAPRDDHEHPPRDEETVRRATGAPGRDPTRLP